MFANLNAVVITGYLVRDPQLRSTAGGTAVCSLRVGVNSRTRNLETGEFGTKPNYFDVTVWGAQGENCAAHLAKGRQVAVEGRLDWREYSASDGGKRQAVSIVARAVQFIGPKADGGGDAEEEDSSAGAAVEVSDDKELMALKRPQLDELAADIGVETPEEYREKKDVVEAIREKEAEKATEDEASVAGDGGKDLDF